MKLNLIVDASGIFYRSLFTVGNYGTGKGQKLLQSEESKGVFMRKLATDFSALVRSVDNVNRVIVCLDSSSWRKKILIEDGGYKSTRKKDESTVDWDSFFQLTQEFTDILGQKGYILSKVKDAEADDILFLWARKLNAAGEAVILVTGDKDLHQVVNLHENGAWTVALDPVAQRRKVFLTKETQNISHEVVEPGEIDFFDSSSWNSSAGDVLFSLLDKNDVMVIDPVEVATRKVLLGDAGDAVPGIATWKDPKDETKIRSLTDAKLKKILEPLPPLTWRNLQKGEHIAELTASLNAVTKLSYLPEDVQKRIERNVQLVVLDEEIIPLSIQQSFATLFEEVASSPVHLTRNVILEGTKWWTEKKPFVPKGYDVTFAGIEDESPFEISTDSSEKDKEALQKALGSIKEKKKNDGGPSALF
jgi:5'-3' exonuclease